MPRNPAKKTECGSLGEIQEGVRPRMVLDVLVVTSVQTELCCTTKEGLSSEWAAEVCILRSLGRDSRAIAFGKDDAQGVLVEKL